MDNITISYLTLRKVIGILALAFPFILIIGGWLGGTPIQSSFSAYYWTNATVLFTGMLVTFGVFLLSYNGYDKGDRIITSIAGIAMILVALFPMVGGTNYLLTFIPGGVVGILHIIFSATTFASLGIMSYFQFTKSGNKMTKAKKKRNIVYKTCGIVIFVSLILLAVFALVPFDPTIILEAAILWSFGVAWLIKGETLLKD